MKHLIWILTLVVAIGFSACIDDTNSGTITIQERDKQIIEDYLAEQNITDYEQTSLGVYYHTIKEGTGENIHADSILLIGYEGWLPYSYIFDSSFARGDTFELKKSSGEIVASYDTLNCFEVRSDSIVLEPLIICDSCPNFSGGVITGWVDAIQQLQVGDRKRFYIPSSLGYGPSGSSGTIPGNAVLIFDIEAYGYKGYLDECL